LSDLHAGLAVRHPERGNQCDSDGCPPVASRSATSTKVLISSIGIRAIEI